VTGVWVGCDERSAHFKNGETGEGSRTALPIFAKFMEKVYHDQSTGYTYGPFPKATVPITRSINCPTPSYAVDTAVTDSVVTDSLNVTPATETETTTQEKQEETKTEEKKAAEPAPKQLPPPPLSRKEERELRRKQRQEERERKKNEN
jgi:penicillin-binding protein 1A